MTGKDDNGFRLTGRHVLAGLVLFFLGVIAANGWMAYRAVTTFDGLERADPYRRGLDYNAVIAAAKTQAALGWEVALVAEVDGAAPEVTLDVTVRDRDGRPLDGLLVNALLWRPVDDGADREIALTPLGSGAYRGAARLDHPGQWEVRLTLRGDGDAVYQYRQRILVKARA
ncbi:MAG: FixH family protein [Pseudomonadota bacterium]